MNTSAGNVGCQCRDESGTLASFTERSCITSDGENGVMIKVEGACVPYSYGSNSCLRHDYIIDPDCREMAEEMATSTANVMRNRTSRTINQCMRSWCYVDAQSCMELSSERVYRSEYFTRDEGVDLFYSFTTCDSSFNDWEIIESDHTLNGQTISVAIPGYIVPYMYKAGPGGPDDILSGIGKEYYNNSVPLEGVLATYMNSLMSIANGDFDVKYTYASKSSNRIHPSRFTSAIQDVEDGLVDMAIGPYWVTGERLQMTSFTIPLDYDRTVLVIPKPELITSLAAQTKKVLDPFTPGLWLLLIATVAFTALLSVWFSDHSTIQKSTRRSRQRPKLPRNSIYARLALDQFLEKGTFFCSAGVEQDKEAGLPNKLLMFGFGLVILIVVSAYVANLAAFLTRNSLNYVGTVQEVIENGMTICAVRTLETDLVRAHPNANYVFNQDKNGFHGLLNDYDAGNCDVLAIGRMDTTGDIELMDKFCNRSLVYTNSLFVENAIAFPIRADLAAGLSYWIYQGKKYHGLTLDFAKEKYDSIHTQEATCNVEFSVQELDAEAREFLAITPQNLFFPFIFFLSFALAAIALQLFLQWTLRKPLPSLMGSLIGRTSLLNLYNDMKDDKADDKVQLPQLLRRPTVTSLGRGSIEEDGVGLDDFNENGCASSLKRRVGPSSREDNATSRLQTMVENGAFDDFLVCVKEIKEQNSEKILSDTI